MGPLSPPSSSHISPKPAPPNPNLNPFSPLSPDLPENKISSDNGNGNGDGDSDDAGAGEGMLQELLGLGNSKSKRVEREDEEEKERAEFRRRIKEGPVIYYTRERMLRIAKRCGKQGWRTPKGMGGLELWYGPVSPTKTYNVQHVDDPAIASIGPPAGGSRRGGGGGFGEGFGFGGGIGGGRGIGRGGRNIGLRRPEAALGPNGLPSPPDNRHDAFGGQMGRFSVRGPGDRGMKLGGDDTMAQGMGHGKGRDQSDRRGQPRRDDNEWRRGDKASAPPFRNGENSRRQQNNYNNNNRYHQQDNDDGPEPAWMDDDTGPTSAALADPATAESATVDDPLIKFVPGEDMIAAHKRAMKARQGGMGDWRGGGEKPLVSFFGGVPAIVASSGPPPGFAEPVKPKVFNSADYLLPSKEEVEDDTEGSEEAVPANNAFTSRFQKFFGAPGSSSGPGTGSSLAPPPGMGARFSSMSGSTEGSVISPSVQSPTEVASPPPQSSSAGPTDDGPVKMDDHMAKLMGLLSTKGPSPLPPRPPQEGPVRPPQPFSYGMPPNMFQALPQDRHDFNQPSQPRQSSPTRNTAQSGVSPPDAPMYASHIQHPAFTGPDPRGFPYAPPPPLNFGQSGGNHPQNLLQQLYDPQLHQHQNHDPRDRSAVPPDPLQLLQRQQQIHHMIGPGQPPQHASMPPGAFGRAMPPPGVRLANSSVFPPPPPNRRDPTAELLRELAAGGIQPPPGYLAMGPRNPPSSTSIPYGPPPPGHGYPPPFGYQPQPPQPQQRGMYPDQGMFSPPGPGGPGGQGGQGLGPPQNIGQLGQNQQDMLATLFSGLGPRQGGN